MPRTKSAFNLETCARPNVLSLQPYRCARDEYPDNGSNILLDANENAFGSSLASDCTSDALNSLSVSSMSLHRYPDPHQVELKKLFSKYRNTHHHSTQTLAPENLFVGMGSDEAIDNVLRCFCIPGKDKILITPPTYGMYNVCATINDVGIVKVPLLPGPRFNPDVPSILSTLSSSNAADIKAVFLCTPGNPTGSLISKEGIQAILDHPTWNGIVVLDEAYIDFASSSSASLAEMVLDYPNLVVLQTLSKAFGCAGIRCGVAFTSPPIAELMNKLKPPYNVPHPTSVLACRALGDDSLRRMEGNRQAILKQRDRLVTEMSKIRGVGRLVGGLDSNFLLVEMCTTRGDPSNQTAMRVYESLAEESRIVVRFRGKEDGCFGCLRITVGTEEEVTRLLVELQRALGEIHDSPAVHVNGEAQAQATSVVA